MGIELVVFDMAGTTVYDGDAVHHCLADALAAAGVDVTRAAINEVMGMPKPRAIAHLLLSQKRDDISPEPVHADFQRRMINYYRIDASVRETEKAAVVFAVLRDHGIKVALDTGFDRAITNVILTRLGWQVGAVIDASVTSDEVPRGRPFPDMIQRAMTLTGVADAARVAKVGDTPSDLEEGYAAGCSVVVGVTSGSHTCAELERCRHTHLIKRLAELPRVVGLDAEVA